MPRLLKNLPFALLLILGTPLACSDDVEPAADPFDVSEPELDATPDTSDAAPDSSPQDATEDSENTQAPDTALPPAEHNICDVSDPAPDPTACPIQQPDAFGDCATPLGVVFDGTQCAIASGCDCDGEDCPAFDTLEDCATTCAQAGFCQAERLPHYLNGACPGDSCFDLTTICAAPSGELSEFEAFLEATLPELRISCSENTAICGVNIFPHTCLPDGWCCTISGPYTFDLPRHQGYCAITLLPTVRALGCIFLE